MSQAQVQSLQVAVIQLTSTTNCVRNYLTAEKFIREAASEGAELIVLPEKWGLLGDQLLLHQDAQLLDGEAITVMKSLAKELSIDIVAGSIVERGASQGKNSNTSVHLSADGTIAAAYRKIHLFDADIDGHVYRESAYEQAGSELVVSSCKNRLFGIGICYDLRFPELFRALRSKGAEFFVLPAAFTAKTTLAHWQVLLQARAVENQAFVVGANQVGTHHPSQMVSGGRSMVVDPWGRILASVTEGEGWALACLDFKLQQDIQKQLPVLQHQRHDLFPYW